jgi:hypothetical protein
MKPSDRAGKYMVSYPSRGIRGFNSSLKGGFCRGELKTLKVLTIIRE